MKIYGSPFRYYQGHNILERSAELIKDCGRRFLIVSDSFVFPIVQDRLKAAFESAGLELVPALLEGECSEQQISAILSRVDVQSFDAVMAVGGGKVMDTGKVIAGQRKKPLIVMPTIAATDGSTSHIAVFYHEDHNYHKLFTMNFSPWIVLVDTTIITKAPLRFFIAGIGDGLATKFEIDTCIHAGIDNYFKGQPTLLAKAIGDLCFQTLQDKAVDAIAAIKAGQTDSVVDDVIEAIVLLSGLGFENGGLAAAHDISSSLTGVPSLAQNMHGELVAFALLLQWSIEQRAERFMREMLDFYTRVGLPRSLNDLNFAEADGEKLDTILKEISTSPDYTLRCYPGCSYERLKNAAFRLPVLQD